MAKSSLLFYYDKNFITVFQFLAECQTNIKGLFFCYDKTKFTSFYQWWEVRLGYSIITRNFINVFFFLFLVECQTNNFFSLLLLRYDNTCYLLLMLEEGLKISMLLLEYHTNFIDNFHSFLSVHKSKYFFLLERQISLLSFLYQECKLFSFTDKLYLIIFY